MKINLSNYKQKKYFYLIYLFFSFEYVIQKKF